MIGPACSARNAVTVDVEDYFHASAFRKIAPPEHWDRYPLRVQQNTRRALNLLAEFKLRATFFVLGWVAERFPALIREIRSAGHDIGCHSYAHRLIYELAPVDFREDTRRARTAIEDAIGVPVTAYRAPTFSFTRQSLWALEILLELGFTTDSSIFPTRNHLYGIPNAPRQPFRIRCDGAELTEYPLSTIPISGYGLPFTGGVYLRFLPAKLQIAAMRKLANEGVPVILYFHPWELDPEQPRLASALGPKFYHYAGLSRTEDRLRRILGAFRFGPLQDLSSESAPVYGVSASGSSVVFKPVSAPTVC